LVTLDVGCGNEGRGDVNCDLFTAGNNKYRHIQDGTIIHEPRKIKNFIVSDALKLPFADNSFETVICSHLIEHINKPFALFRECVRVSKNQVIISCPHRYGEAVAGQLNPKFYFWSRKHHINKMNIEWFSEASKRLNVRCEGKVTEFLELPKLHPWIKPIFSIPLTIEITITK
jgi:ubiquinone/menaquinone biosynthesis C-methylase UbiE